MLRSIGVFNASPKDIRELAGVFQSSIRRHEGKTVRAVGNGMPTRWVLIGNQVATG